ncbi:MAG: sugar phosphate isomerase/epimerase [Verrucomicrobiales bacterium]|nr:sugar phosphate isomerase/epimerase [Verrucomicrobiales bacterium]
MVLLLLLLLLGTTLAQAAPSPPPPKFYAYCVEVGVPGVTPRPWPDQATLLRQLGYDGGGFELPLDTTLATHLRAFDDAGLDVYLVWTTLNVNPASPAYDPRLPDALRQLKGRPTTVSLILRGLPPADPKGRAPALRALRELGDVAAQAGLRLSIYNHVSDWTESLPFIVELVRELNHPQVGFNFNLCHWLKVDAAHDWRPLLREHAAKLFCVTINGATVGAQTWTHGLIRPLDEGDFDNAPLLAALNAIGYRGPVGLMCYGVPGDPRDHLARSMAVWRRLHSPQPSQP